jgi:hypothetical protein
VIILFAAYSLSTAFILWLSWTSHLSRDVPATAYCLCDKGAVLGAPIKDTLIYKTWDRKPILWQASVVYRSRLRNGSIEQSNSSVTLSGRFVNVNYKPRYFKMASQYFLLHDMTSCTPPEPNHHISPCSISISCTHNLQHVWQCMYVSPKSF